MAWKIIMPKLGMTMREGRVVEWLVKEGEKVEKGQIILHIESDKIQFEVEAPDTGIVAKILTMPSDESLPVGHILALIVAENEQYSLEKLLKEATAPVTVGAEDEQAPESLEMAPWQQTGQSLADQQLTRKSIQERTSNFPPSSIAQTQTDGIPSSEKIRATPVAKKLAEEKGVNLALVKGTGPGGRITREDVEAYVSNHAQLEIRETMQTGEIREITLGTIIPLSRQRKIISQRLFTSYSTVPHIYLFSEIDASELRSLRSKLLPSIKEQTGHDLSYNDLLIEIVASSLVRYPLFNATLEGDKIRIWKDINIGLAVATDDGLIVPVIRAVQDKSLKGIVSERAGLVFRALNKKLAYSDVEAGTFTISNLGMFGVDYFTAIINPPQTAILTVGRMVERPWVIDGEVVVRPIMQLGLSADHRVVDGALAASFLQDIKVKLEGSNLELW